MRALLIGDLHLSDRGPSSRVDGYTQDILDKLDFIIAKANELEVDAVISLGDFFDNKIPHRTSHELIQLAIDSLGKSKAPIFIVCGNHDVTNNLISSLPRQPLGTILRMPNVHHLTGYNEYFNIVGVPYHDDPDDWAQYLEPEQWNDETLVCMHASIFPESEMPPYEAISAENLAELIPAHFIAYGHIHTPPKKGAYYKVPRTADVLPPRHTRLVLQDRAPATHTWFCNRGAISRGSLHGENLVRQVGVTLFDSTNRDEPFTNIDVPMKPASEVFRLEEKQLVDESKSRVVEFLETIDDIESTWVTKEMIKAKVLEALGTENNSLVDQIFEGVD